MPFPSEHWQAVVAAIGLSDQHARVVELVLRGHGNKQIADVMGLSERTVKDYLQRIAKRTGTRGRLKLAVHVLGVSYRLLDGRCP